MIIANAMTAPRTTFVLVAASLLLVGAGCAKKPAPAATPRPSPAPAAAPPQAVNADPEVPQFSQCLLAADQEVTLYMRADAGAEVFGKLAGGEAVVLGGRTDDGWYGFDPAAAQAPNVGPFRMRWIKPGSPVTVTGDCSRLTAYPHVDPKGCYVMAETDAKLRSAPSGSADVVADLHYGDYALATGRTAGVRNDFWVKIDAGSGSLKAGGSGWASMDALNFNGPCEKLPVAK